MPNVDYIIIDTSVSSPVTYVKAIHPTVTYTTVKGDALSFGGREDLAQAEVDSLNGPTGSRYTIGTRPRP